VSITIENIYDESSVEEMGKLGSHDGHWKFADW
jgi:hypothetical protein